MNKKKIVKKKSSHNQILKALLLPQLFSLFSCAPIPIQISHRSIYSHDENGIPGFKMYEFSWVSAFLQDKYTHGMNTTYALQSNNFSYNFSYFHHERRVLFFYCAIFDMCLSVYILLMVRACMHIHSDIEYCQEHSKTEFFPFFFFSKNIYR